ncbi:MAG: malonyl-ACP O-methyltransferase BioC [Gammaproteobacteria bacterium]|jgi:malonyl-CoA O-methyltransferase
MINKNLARLSFEKAATGYDEAAVLQREIGQRLLDRLDYIRFQPQRILDVGAGTGDCSFQLADFYKKSEVIALDFATAMLKQAKQKRSLRQRLSSRFKFITADAGVLPLVDNSVDMIFSNLALQWCADLEQVFREFRRVLKPNGMLLFSTFGPDTLKELRECWQQVDNYQHINEFTDLHVVGDAMMKTGFSDPVMDMEMITVTYPDVKSIMRDLKQIGAHNVNSQRAKGLTGKQTLQKLMASYENYRRESVLPVSHEVIYGHAWVPEEKTAAGSQCGVQQVSLDELKNTLEKF